MFYAQFVLSKKGPLAKIWLAAHWEKKLSKAQIYETNVQDAVDEILQPKAKMALRTTGHLLLGIVRIYSRKTKYLLADCNEAFLKIKMAFRPGQMDLFDDNAKEANEKAATLPEVCTDFDATLPDFNDLDFTMNVQVSQSRIDDITLKEDVATDSQNNMFSNDFGLDDFGEGGMETTIDDFNTDFGMNSFMEPNHNHEDINNYLQQRDAREPTPSLEGVAVGGRNIFPTDDDDDFGCVDIGDDDHMPMDSMYQDNLSVIGDAPGADGNEDMYLGAAANNIRGGSMDAASESFALDPLDTNGYLDSRMQMERKKRKRRLIIDEQKNITGDEMKANMSDYTDTLQSLDLAPPSRVLMKMKEQGTVEKLFHLPGCIQTKARPLIRYYQSNLILRARAEGTQDAANIREELNLSEVVEDLRNYADSNYGGFDDDDIVSFDMEPPRCDTPPAVMALDLPEEEDSPSKDSDDMHMPEKKKRKLNDSSRMDDDEAAEGDEDHRWTKRTQGVLNSISSKIRSNGDEIVLHDLLTKGSTRKTAAQKFYTLLVLKKWQAIEVRQNGSYADIMISAGPNIGQTLSQ